MYWLWDKNKDSLNVMCYLNNQESEMELLEEESEMSCFFVLLRIWELSVSIRKGFSKSFGEFRSLFSCGDTFFFNIFEIDISGGVSGGHKVIVIDELNESFDLCSFDESLFRHSSGDISWSSINTYNQSRCELSRLVSVIIASNDDGFLASMSSWGEDSDSSSSEYFAH